MSKEKEEISNWISIGKPGYLGKNKDELVVLWNQKYGEGKWRLAWQLASGEVLGYSDIFQLYVDSYTQYFETHLDEAYYLTENFAYAYDKDLVSKEESFNLYSLYFLPGRPNQFHHVALNHALELRLFLEFKGVLPIQVREGNPGTDPNTWPKGWRWSPGRIPAIHSEQIPAGYPSSWWQAGSIEDLYQSAKILQITK